MTDRLTALYRSTAIAAVAGIALGAAPVAAQEVRSGQDQQQAEEARNQQQTGEGGSAAASETARDQGGQSGDGARGDMIVATVGDEEIRNSDVTEAISTLPAQARQQPAEMLVPMAVRQLVLRELIVQEAEAENLGESEAVTAKVQDQAAEAREDAMVAVWIERELEDRVTDDKVQAVYDGLQAANPDEELPPLEQVRPQLEQRVAQQAIVEIRDELMEDGDVTFYGPDGNPQMTPGEEEQSNRSSGGSGTSGEQAEDTN